MRVCDLADVSLRGIFNKQQKMIYSPQTGPQSSSNSCSRVSIKTNKNRLKNGAGGGGEEKKKREETIAAWRKGFPHNLIFCESLLLRRSLARARDGFGNRLLLTPCAPGRGLRADSLSPVPRNVPAAPSGRGPSGHQPRTSASGRGTERAGPGSAGGAGPWGHGGPAGQWAAAAGPGCPSCGGTMGRAAAGAGRAVPARPRPPRGRDWRGGAAARAQVRRWRWRWRRWRRRGRVRSALLPAAPGGGCSGRRGRAARGKRAPNATWAAQGALGAERAVRGRREPGR